MIYVEIDLFVSNLISHSLYIVCRYVDVMNLHVVRATIEYSLHRVVIVSNHAIVDQSNDVTQQIRRFSRDEIMNDIAILKDRLNDYETNHFDDV